jgi:hypothetical protein
MFWQKHLHFPPSSSLVHRGLQQSIHTRYGRVTLPAQAPKATDEAWERLLLRTAPVAMGILLGGHTDNLLLGALIGLVVAVLLDLRLNEYSLIRPRLSRKQTK